LNWEYVEEQDGGRYSNIQMQRVGSVAKTRLTYGKYLDKFPAFTPDGKRVVFSSNRTSDNSTLWAVSADTPAGITKLTNTQAEDYSPTVAPDGQLIGFTSLLPRADEPQIWTVPLGSSLMTQLREGESPQISPDGKQILFVRRDKSSANKARQLWLMSVDGARETQLTQNTDHETIDARWSPDGKWIVYATDEGRDSKSVKNFDIWIMAADGSKRTQLTTNGSWDDSPCFDAKGETVYFRSNRGGAWNIWRFQPMLPN
jgi:Tol biopolymer transport system component